MPSQNNLHGHIYKGLIPLVGHIYTLTFSRIDFLLLTQFSHSAVQFSLVGLQVHKLID